MSGKTPAPASHWILGALTIAALALIAIYVWPILVVMAVIAVVALAIKEQNPAVLQMQEARPRNRKIPRS